MAVELIISGKTIDFGDRGLGTSLTYKVANLLDFKTARGDSSLTVELPLTKGNAKIFGAIGNLGVSIIDNDPRKRLLKATLVDKGQVVLDGFAKIIDWTTSQVNVQLIGGNSNWMELLRDRAIGDVDRGVQFDPVIGGFGERVRRWQNRMDFTILHAQGRPVSTLKDFAISGVDITADDIYKKQPTFCFPAINYDGLNEPLLDDDAQNYRDAFRQLRPAVYVWPLLQAHFAEAGVDLKSEFLEKGFLENYPLPPLIIPFTGDEDDEEWKDFSSDNEQLPFLRIAEYENTVNQTIEQPILNTSAQRFVEFDKINSYIYPNFLNAADANGFGNIVIPIYNETRAHKIVIDLRFNVLSQDPANFVGNEGVALTYFVDFSASTLGAARSVELRFTDDSTPLPASFFVRAEILVKAEEDAEVLEIESDLPHPVRAALLGATVDPTNPPPQNALVFRAASLTPSPGDPVTLELEMLPGSAVEVFDVPGQEVLEGNLFDVRDKMIDITVGDLIKSITTTFDLIWITDTNARTVSVEPRKDFLQNLPVEISKAIDTAEEISAEFAGAELARVSRFLYQEDDDDVLLEVSKDGDLTFGHLVFDAGLQILQDTEDEDVESFSSSNSGWSGTHVRAQLLSEGGDNRFDFEPRILLSESQMRFQGAGNPSNANVLLALLADAFDGSQPGVPFDTGELGMGRFPLWRDSFFALSGASLRFDTSEFAEAGLFDRFYQTRFQNLLQSRRVSARMRLNDPSSIGQLQNFRAPVRWQDKNYQLLEIDDYEPGGSELVDVSLLELTPVEQPVVEANRSFTLRFTNLSQSVSLPSSQVDGAGGFRFLSYHFWLKEEAEPNSLLGIYSNALAVNLAQSIAKQGNVLIVSIWDVVTGDKTVLKFLMPSQLQNGLADLQHGQWMHFAITLDGQQLRQSFAFANGVLMPRFIETLDILATEFDTFDSGSVLGRAEFPDGTQEGFIGQMAEFMMQNVSVSSGEVEWRYGQGFAQNPINTELTRMFIRLDQPSGRDILPLVEFGAVGLLEKVANLPSTQWADNEVEANGGAWVRANPFNSKIGVPKKMALHFDGVNDIAQSTSTTPELNGTDALTISLWAKIDQFDTRGATFVDTTFENFATKGLVLFINQNTSNGELFFNLAVADGNQGGSNGWVFGFDITSLVQLGAWHHYAMMREKDTITPRAFFDGAEVAITVTNPGATADARIINSDRLTLGRFESLSGGQFARLLNGSLSDLLIQKRAISEQEIERRAQGLPANDTKNMLFDLPLGQNQGDFVPDFANRLRNIRYLGAPAAALEPGGGVWVENDL